VNIALTQMDEVTQQNSALVEQNASAAKSLEEQSQAMNERVSQFRVGTEGSAESVAPARGAKTNRRTGRSPAPVTRGNTALAQAVDREWEEF
jgi:methyl-accepting chemotaxis protein